MTSRVAAAIDAARAEGRGAFVGYLPLGFPDLQTSIDAAVALAESGADILELGPPYSDPVMDGTIIQEATQAALAGGFRLRDTFTAVREITRRVDVPVLVMTYWNPVLQYGVDRYADDLLAAGGAGLITPDITPGCGGGVDRREPAHRPRPRLPRRADVDRRAARAHRRESSTGFVYTVSTMGITGERAQLDAAARTLVARLREHGVEHACVGIGISNAEQVAGVLEYADGAIVGTALVRALRDGGVDGPADVATRSSPRAPAQLDFSGRLAAGIPDQQGHDRP